MVLGNSIFIGFRYGLDIRDKETGDALTAGTSQIKNNIYQSYTAGKDVVADGAVLSFATVDLLKTYLTTNTNVTIDETAAAALLNSPFTLTGTPVFTLKTGSVAASGAVFTK